MFGKSDFLCPVLFPDPDNQLVYGLERKTVRDLDGKFQPIYDIESAFIFLADNRQGKEFIAQLIPQVLEFLLHLLADIILP